MANLLVAEFVNVAEDGRNYQVDVGELAPVAEYTITGGASSAQGPILQTSTRLLRLKSTGGNGVIAFGQSPTAAATGALHLSDGVVEYFGVPGGGNPGRLAFINAT